MVEVVLLSNLVNNAFSSCFPLQNHNFASDWIWKSYLQNGMHEVLNDALPIKDVLSAILCQSSPWLRLFCCHTWLTMHFPSVSPFKNSILPQIEWDNAIYRMVCIRFWMMCYLSDIFFSGLFARDEPHRLFICNWR